MKVTEQEHAINSVAKMNSTQKRLFCASVTMHKKAGGSVSKLHRYMLQIITTQGQQELFAGE